jgi:hypothetical protein
MAQTANPSVQSAPRSAAWWRFGHVWLVIAGPAAVVVAALFTGWLAVRSADPVVDEDYYRKGVEINKTLATQTSAERARSLAPALQGRNHAATPTGALPAAK